jgi:ferredoxin
MSEVLLLFTCIACGRPSLACPNCVTTVRIDPHTGLPIDVALVNGQPVTIEPTAAARARSRHQPICDDCVRRRNARYPDGQAWITAAERHDRTHR